MLMAIHDSHFEGMTLADMFDFLKRGGMIHSGFQFAMDGQPDDGMFEGFVDKGKGERISRLVSLGRMELTFANMEDMIRRGIEHCYETGNLVGVQIENEDAETWAFESHEVLAPSIAWKEYQDAIFDSPEAGWKINPIRKGDIEDYSVISDE